MFHELRGRHYCPQQSGADSRDTRAVPGAPVCRVTRGRGDGRAMRSGLLCAPRVIAATLGVLHVVIIRQDIARLSTDPARAVGHPQIPHTGTPAQPGLDRERHIQVHRGRRHAMQHIHMVFCDDQAADRGGDRGRSGQRFNEVGGFDHKECIRDSTDRLHSAAGHPGRAAGSATTATPPERRADGDSSRLVDEGQDRLPDGR